MVAPVRTPINPAVNLADALVQAAECSDRQRAGFVLFKLGTGVYAACNADNLAEAVQDHWGVLYSVVSDPRGEMGALPPR